MTAALALFLGAGVLASCGRGGEAPAATVANAGVTVGAENIAIAATGVVRSGPALTGTLEPEREATVRAQVSGPVAETPVEVGQPVAKGQLLVRIDDTSLRDAYISAKTAVSTAKQGAAVAQKEAERTARLAKAGALAQKDLEAAQLQASNAEAQVQAAQARLALAEKQLADTKVEAPITGVVSARPVSAGDVVQIGTELATVVDPTSMRLEAAVPSEELAALRVGAPVSFEVNGYPGRTFQGTVSRISPAVDPTTRQVPVTVSIPNAGGQLVAGLYAQGRIATEQKQGVVVPSSAVSDMQGSAGTVLRVRHGVAQKVPVRVGLQDQKEEEVLVVSGVAAGDTLLVGAARAITPGTPVRVERLGEAPTDVAQR